MTALELRSYPDPLLRRAVDAVDCFDDELGELAEAMFDLLYRCGAVGLSAPQVGVGRRLFVFDVGAGPQAVVNPVVNPVVDTTASCNVALEACLSVPGLRLLVPRASQLTLRGCDLRGRPVVLSVDGLAARVCQHEIDHLDGRLLLDRLDTETLLAGES